jgi:hypothetical protein
MLGNLIEYAAVIGLVIIFIVWTAENHNARSND